MSSERNDGVIGDVLVKAASRLGAIAHDLVPLMRFHRVPLWLNEGSGPSAMTVVALPFRAERPPSFRSRQAVPPDQRALPTRVIPGRYGKAQVVNLQREVVDLAFEVKKFTGQRAAVPDASGTQFRERALGDALANDRGLGGLSALCLRQNLWIGLSGPIDLQQGRAPSPLRACREMPSCSLQRRPVPNERSSRLCSGGDLGLLAGRGDNLVGILARGVDLFLAVDRSPNRPYRRRNGA